jgi:hypothetical protein
MTLGRRIVAPGNASLTRRSPMLSGADIRGHGRWFSTDARNVNEPPHSSRCRRSCDVQGALCIDRLESRLALLDVVANGIDHGLVDGSFHTSA